MFTERYENGEENISRTFPNYSQTNSWRELLSFYPDHEKHLESSDGRFEAVLNIIKNGGMTLAVLAMDSNWASYFKINAVVNTLISYYFLAEKRAERRESW